MVTIINDPAELKYSPLMALYAEDLCARAQTDYPSLSLNEGLMGAEQDFYAYMTQVFLKTEGAYLALWGNYEAALRMEPYLDGYLLTGLSTAPHCRRQGYATSLLNAVVQMLPSHAQLYSHVEKQNAPSIAFHEKFGFTATKPINRLFHVAHQKQVFTADFRNNFFLHGVYVLIFVNENMEIFFSNFFCDFLFF